MVGVVHSEKEELRFRGRQEESCEMKEAREIWHESPWAGT